MPIHDAGSFRVSIDLPGAVVEVREGTAHCEEAAGGLTRFHLRAVARRGVGGTADQGASAMRAALEDAVEILGERLGTRDATMAGRDALLSELRDARGPAPLLRAVAIAPLAPGWWLTVSTRHPEEDTVVRAAFDAMLRSVEIVRSPRDDRVAGSSASRSVSPSPPAPPPVVLPPPRIRLAQAIDALGLADRREAIEALAAPTVRLREGEALDPGGAGLGRSRVGGGPDLPRGEPWPRDGNGFHWTFLMQVDLASLPEVGLPLPREGLLSIFCGAEVLSGLVLLTPPGAPLVHHPLPETIEDDTESAWELLEWSPARRRMVPAEEGAGDGIVAKTGADGRLKFAKDGEPLVVLASQDVSRTPHALRPEATLSMPHMMHGDPSPYEALGLVDGDEDEALSTVFDDPYPGHHAPRHHVGGHSFTELGPEGAVAHAREQGWHDLTDPADWFLLAAIDSGGGAGFCFWDAGVFVVMANRRDTVSGRLDRIFARVWSS